jgi:hypothetical protein
MKNGYLREADAAQNRGGRAEQSRGGSVVKRKLLKENK